MAEVSTILVDRPAPFVRYRVAYQLVGEGMRQKLLIHNVEVLVGNYPVTNITDVVRSSKKALEELCVITYKAIIGEEKP